MATTAITVTRVPIGSDTRRQRARSRIRHAPARVMVWRRGLALLAMVGLVAAGVQASLHGLANVYGLFPAQRLGAWQSARQVPEPEELSLALGQLRTARALDPGNPGYMDDQGLLWEWAAAGGDTLASPRDALEQARDAHREAIRLRPLWPYSWANLARVKAQLGEVDVELALALEKASRLGPWEPKVQRSIADAGMRVWDQLGPAPRRAVLENLQRGVRIQREAMLRIAMRYKKIHLLARKP